MPIVVGVICFIECMGTAYGVHDQFASNPQKRVEFYREMYGNCTIVLTNLEIVHLYPAADSDYDLSFFENIREVHGYVLVASNLVSRVPLTSLRVIRGLEQFKLPTDSKTTEDGTGFSLYVAANIYQQPDGLKRGLRVLELPSLRGRQTYLLDVS